MLHRNKNYSEIVKKIMIGVLIGASLLGIILGATLQTETISINPYGNFEQVEKTFNYALMMYLWASGLVAEMFLFVAFAIIHNQEILINNQIILFGEGKPIEAETSNDSTVSESEITIETTKDNNG